MPNHFFADDQFGRRKGKKRHVEGEKEDKQFRLAVTENSGALVDHCPDKYNPETAIRDAWSGDQ